MDICYNKEFVPATEEYKRVNYRLPDNFEMSPEIDRAFNEMEQSDSCIFVTGKAGTGKSTTLQHFRNNTKKKIAVLAPTGVAAVNIDAVTIHSFFGLPWGLINYDNDIRIKENSEEIIKAVDAIVIDEISMVNADVITAIDRILRRETRSNKPFGGIQMILFGDLFQLPPVVVGRELNQYFDQRYGGPFFFNADIFNEINMKYIELTKVYRQADADFVEMLDKIRHKRINFQELGFLNHLLCRKQRPRIAGRCLTLTATNAVANQINNYHLNIINEREHQFDAVIQGDFRKDSYPTLLRLKLKKGAQIMMVKNDMHKRWVNGSVGYVSDLSDIHITVCLDGATYDIYPEKWENFDYIYNPGTRKIQKEVTGTFEQYPLKLAWAVTIHKAQGHTLSSVHIDLGDGAFCHGQAYVGLSRCRTLEGISLAKPLQLRDIIFDDRIYGYIDKFTKH